MIIVKFTRTNYNIKPLACQEEVAVIIQGKYSENKAWQALWEQYPQWACPYHQGNPPPNKFENLRHGFSSPHLEKGIVKV